MSMLLLNSFLPARTSVAWASSSGGGMSPTKVAEGDHAVVCAELASHIRREATRSKLAGAAERLARVAYLVEASAFLPAGDYLWTVQLSPAMLVTYRVTEILPAEDDLGLVA